MGVYPLHPIMAASHELIQFIAIHHYAALFFLILIEEAGFPLPLPGESLIIFAGSRIAAGQMNIGLIFLSILPASAIGCTILYCLARTGGRALVQRFGAKIHLDSANLDRIEAKITKIGPVAVLLGRLTPGIRVPTDIVAGIFRIPFRYYLPFALLATAIRLVFFLYVGATAQHLRSAIAITRDAKFITAVAVLAVVLAGWMTWRRHIRPRLHFASRGQISSVQLPKAIE